MSKRKEVETREIPQSSKIDPYEFLNETSNPISQEVPLKAEVEPSAVEVTEPEPTAVAVFESPQEPIKVIVRVEEPVEKEPEKPIRTGGLPEGSPPVSPQVAVAGKTARMKVWSVRGGNCPRRFIVAENKSAAEQEYRNLYALRRLDLAFEIIGDPEGRV